MQIAGQSASALLAFHPANATALRWEDCPFRPIMLPVAINVLFRHVHIRPPPSTAVLTRDT